MTGGLFPLSFTTLGLLLTFGGVAIAQTPPPGACPPRDGFVCKFNTIDDANNELIIIPDSEPKTIKNGKLYGIIGKKPAKSPLAETSWNGGGQIFEMRTSPLERMYRFVETAQSDATTDLNAVLKKSKRGSVTIFPETHMGWYEFDGGKKSGLLCTEKYHSQIDPAKDMPPLTDEDACRLQQGEEWPLSPVASPEPKNAKTLKKRAH